MSARVRKLISSGCEDMVCSALNVPRQTLITFAVGHEKGLSVCSSGLEGVTWTREGMVAMLAIFLEILRHVSYTDTAGPPRVNHLSRLDA